ncbi:MAG TPA: hypothetical protein VFQ25_09265 [Ktedonobacterales bacterium]|nr:hypothetical protein [Ktedonobacterales bacterium]
MPDTIPREQLLQEFADAFERVIETASAAARREVSANAEGWGPREYVAHLAGWEIMATVRVPKIAAGMAPLEEADAARGKVMTDAINATIIAMIGDQPLEAVCGILRRAYQRDIAILRSLDERFFQPGEYVYERTRGVIEHCQEHIEDMAAG